MKHYYITHTRLVETQTFRGETVVSSNGFVDMYSQLMERYGDGCAIDSITELTSDEATKLRKLFIDKEARATKRIEDSAK